MIPLLEKRNSQDFSGSSDEDETITIIEAQRAPTSPPRKKRRLSNGQQIISQQSPSTDDTEEFSDSNEEKSSDKENDNHNIKITGKKRKRFTALTQNTSNNKRRRHKTSTQPKSQSSQTKFGKMTLNTPIDIQPGAIVRLELINFLCHANFTIAFHPCVNIIYGQNGSGKSAIEAGISMALGINAKKTGRGNNIKDVIKFGCDFALIKLYLHNQGSEALTDQNYGDEICIERKLTTNGKNGTSSFRVLNSRLKKVGVGVKAVRQIVDKLNINVDNPCVVLKQSTAKEFLNSTKTSDKFKFFMQASKLQDYETNMNEARANVYQAKEQQKQTKGAFSQIKERYFECKRQYDALIKTHEEEERVKQWKVAEKWMKYHGEKGKLAVLERKCKDIENKVVKGKEQLERVKGKLTSEIETGHKLKAEYEEKQTAAEKYVIPVNEVKKTMTKYETERKNLCRNVSSKQKFIDKSRRKIKNYEKEYQQLTRSLENNERGRKLAALQQKINKASEKMHQYKNQRDPLKQKIEPTIEMKDNEAKLNAKRTELDSKKRDVNGFKQQLQQISRGQNNRSEMFRDPNIARRNISIQQIKQEIQRHHRKFRHLPIGPLGEYIKMVPHQDQNILTRHIQIVQAVLGQALFVFLVDSTVDQQIFKSIMRKKFGITVPTIQFKYDTNMFKISHNQFENYRPRDRDGPIIRVTDMFTIKDNNPWIYNAIIVHSQPERVYAHGTLDVARQFLQSLDQSKLKYVNNVMTYQEKQLYKVQLRGRTVQGNPVRQTQPILQSDTSKYKLWIQQQAQRAYTEQQEIEQSITNLWQFVKQSQQNLQSYQRQFNQVNRNIKTLEQQLERYTREQREIQEDENDDDELQQQMQEIQNSIQDEKSQIEELEEEIAPYKQRGDQLLDLLTQKKRELHELESKVKHEQSSIAMLKNKFQTFCDEIRKSQQKIKKVPAIIKQYEQQLEREKQDYEREEKRIKVLLGDARRAGNEITKENYPKNAKNKNRPFRLIELQRERQKREAQLEEWRDANKDPQEIKDRFDAIKPLYETHQDRVDQCNLHVDEMNRLLSNRKKQWQKMREYVKWKLNQEFRLIMRKQGHDGELHVDYGEKELNMKVRMASHDGATQVVNSKTLSGGERSFTQVALIMALQQFSGSPMCIYDEFDVFMDSVNRGNSIKILLKAALNEEDPNKKNGEKKTAPQPPDRQYIFITPNDVSPVIAGGHNKNLIQIHKLNPPRK